MAIKVRGGDTVRLKNGKVVRIYDIKNDIIMISYDEWYSMDDVVEIVDRVNI